MFPPLATSFRVPGTMDGYPESFYDLLPSTPDAMDSDSSSARGDHPSRECNMLHLLGAGAAVGGVEEDAIQRTLEEQVAYELERLEQARAHEADPANKLQNGEFLSA